VTTLASARTTLAATLSAAVTYSVMDHEPAPGGLSKPMYVTVNPAGISPTEYLLAVRCYSDTSQAPVDRALDRLEGMVQAVEDALPSAVPHGTWQMEWSELHNAYIATLVAEYPRDDF
jgi:hypothetical protein